MRILQQRAFITVGSLYQPKEYEMSRSNKNSVGRVIAKTRAGASNVSTGGDGVYSTKSGGYKSGNNRFETSKRGPAVQDHIRSKKKNKDGCFITTAACEYQGLPDDCYELMVMRRFRDSVLLTTSEGRKLVSSYYEIAPRILSRLDKNRDIPLVWSAIQNCVDAITSGNNADAIAIYKAMVLALQKNRVKGGKLSAMPL